MKGSIFSISLLAGTMLLIFPAGILLCSSIIFIAGYSINQFNLWIPIILTGCFGLWGTRQYFKKNRVRITGCLLLLVTVTTILLGIISAQIFDISYDGQIYHQEAIIVLANGWNPVYDMLTSDRTVSAVLLNHYSRGSWIYEAVAYFITGSIETGKVFNLLLMLAAFFIVLAALLKLEKVSVFWAFCGAMLISFNPVSIYQALSFYLDGQLAAILAAMLATYYLLFDKWDNVYIVALAAEIILLCNIKFTGVVYSLVGLVIFIIWLIKNKRQYWKKATKLALACSIVAVIMTGINPYLSNTFYYGHPFYPLYGAGVKNMDIMTLNSPNMFLQMNSVQKMFYGIFGAVSNQTGGENPVLKIPLSISKDEISPFVSGADIRIGGFGPWFSGALLFSTAIFIALIWRKSFNVKMVGWLLGSILITVLINPECWWARYAPQVWLLPIIVMLYAVSSRQKNIIVCGRILAVILLINIIMITYPYLVGNIYTTQAVKQGLSVMAEREEPIRINFEEFFYNKVRFSENGVKYVSVQNYIDETGQEVTMPCELTYRYWRYDYLTAGEKAVFESLGLD